MAKKTLIGFNTLPSLHEKFKKRIEFLGIGQTQAARIEYLITEFLSGEIDLEDYEIKREPNEKFTMKMSFYIDNSEGSTYAKFVDKAWDIRRRPANLMNALMSWDCEERTKEERIKNENAN